ncbi:MAG: hypothetical protein NZL93_00200 [Chthoniobacterales bacterium]|nr:hypothetical protein [Chthoniobacterales bacterium]
MLEDNLIRDNVFVEGEVGTSAGGYYDGPYRHKNIRILNNAFFSIGRNSPTNRKISFGIQIRDWDSGLVQGNILSDFPKKASHSWAFHITQSQNKGKPKRHHSKKYVLGFNTASKKSAAVIFDYSNKNETNCRFASNIIYLPETGIFASWPGKKQN